MVRLRTVATVLGAIALSVVPAVGASASGSPIQPGNQPTPLAGQTNGDVSSDQLVVVAPHCSAARAAAPSLALLLRTARNRGVTLGTEECYRPLQGQVAAQSQATAAGNSACAASVQRAPAGGPPKGTSMHGWGKAVDFSGSGGTVTFGSAAYGFLKSTAGRLGWNHPGWAEPGGSACPEAWHWEWVGDGGVYNADAIRADVVGLLPTADEHGYATVTGLGALTTRGDAVDRGSTGSTAIHAVIVGATATADRAGYWLVASDGGIFNFGSARFLGSTGATALNQPIVGMAATPDGGGYWLVAADGGVFTFGTARFLGSTGGMRLRRPVVGMAATPDGGGYWLVASDGGIFSFGDARFAGSTGSTSLNEPVVAMAPSPDGGGYLLVASDGGVFTFGNARFRGTTATQPLAQPIVSVVGTGAGDGYWLVAADGQVFPFGHAAGFGPG